MLLGNVGLIVWAVLAIWQRPCRQTAPLNLSDSRPPCPTLWADLTPLLIALGFWSVGIAAWSLKKRDSPVEFFGVIAGALAAGVLTTTGSDPAVRLFYGLLAWLAPLTIHFHHTLLNRPPHDQERWLLGLFYGLALFWSWPFLFWDFVTLQRQGWFVLLRLGIRLTWGLALIVAISLLIRDYRRRVSPAVRRHIRLVTFGTLAAFAPFLLLSLLPETLGAPLRVPYAYTFPWLLLSPLAYAYSLFRHRLTRFETLLNRAAVFYLLAVLLLGSYLVIIALISRLAMTGIAPSTLTGALLAVGLLLLMVTPLQQGLYRLLTWVFYGGEINHTRLAGRLAEALALALDRPTLHRLLVEELPLKMQLSGGLLLLKNDADALEVIAASGLAGDGLIAAPSSAGACEATAGTSGNDEQTRLPFDPLPGDSDLAVYMAAIAEPIASEPLRRIWLKTTLQPAEQALLQLDGVAFWLPLVSDGALHGLLLLGDKLGGDFFTAEDRRVLATVAYQSGIAAHNVRLIDQVRAGRRELALAHQQLLVGRERERRQLAHDLHDSALQQLLGISYQLVESRRLAAQQPGGDGQTADQVNDLLLAAKREILDVVSQLRYLIGDLRPAGLEELGLTAALDGYIARLVREGGPDTPRFQLDLAHSGLSLPEPVTICLFRVAQEAVRNALKHAQARQIHLRLRLLSDEAVLTIRDDGRGFRVPARLSEFAQGHHFGLVGMAERVRWSGGCLTIESQPGRGTEVRVRIPLATSGADQA